MDNTIYIFDKEDAIKKRSAHCEKFYSAQKRYKIMSGIHDLLFWSTVPVFVVFITMTVYAWVMKIDIFGDNNVFLYLLLSGMGCVFIPTFAEILGNKIRNFKEKNMYDTYTNTLWFLYFFEKNKEIESTNMTIENGIATMHINYYEPTEKFGRVLCEYTIDKFKVVRTGKVKTPTLNINEGIYYIPIM